MAKYLFTALLAFGSLLSAGSVSAQSDYRNTVRLIEQEYQSQNNGRMISDDQLSYYLDQSDAGWSMEQIRRDMAASQQRYNTGNPWRPQSGWSAREVVCSSDGSKYRECPLPFQGRAVLTQRISSSACVEGQSWGLRPGTVWVNKGCRARFGMSQTAGNNNANNRRTVTCQSNDGKYRQCNTGFAGRVQLQKKLNNSAACVAGSTWGQREGMVWVTRNCRAQFSSVNQYAGNSNYSVTCSSNDNKQTRCNWDARYGQPRIAQQLSKAACVKGSTWGYDRNNSLWVSGGCRARFAGNANNYGNNGNYNNGNWQGDANYSVTCSSDGNAMTRCNWDARYGQPRIVQQLSKTACVKGSTWDYDRNNSLWVNGGCRARFAGNANNNGYYENDNNGNWQGDANYSVTCSSESNAMTRCGWDERYGQPRLIQQLSQAACTSGRTWGYEINRGLWVTGGCRARFGR